MVMSIAYLVLALLALCFLIFIHELGHYFVGRKVGMKIEVFSIGFGKPIRAWEWHGVKWQICWVPFGGYVRFAGMEKKGSVEPYEIPNGFFGKGPWKRIQVVLAGPLVNILFGLFLFTVIWIAGGRMKPFAEVTNFFGWLPTDSSAYEQGVRPGDRLKEVNGRHVQGFFDLSQKVLLDSHRASVTVEKIDFFTRHATPLIFQLDPVGALPSFAERLQEIRTMVPASFLLYHGAQAESMPLDNSGIQEGDQIVWVDGQRVFSVLQLTSIVNASRVLLTIERHGQHFVARVPRLPIKDIWLDSSQRAEIDDWRHEVYGGKMLEDLFFIPYVIDSSGTIEQATHYVDEDTRHNICYSPVEAVARGCVERPLLPGDRILAVSGEPVGSALDIFSILQTKKTQVIVLRRDHPKTVSWRGADGYYLEGFDAQAMSALVHSIGIPGAPRQQGQYHLLCPVTPISYQNFPPAWSQRSAWARERERIQEAIRTIPDHETREKQQKLFEREQRTLRLGLIPSDLYVSYNPAPWVLVTEASVQTWLSMRALVTGFASPKDMAGPLTIVRVIQRGWSEGCIEGMFWLGVISVNLGLFNLLPIPVLDGGHICFALWEAITRRPVKARVMEWLIIPFVVLLVAVLLFVTYHDIARLIRSVFH